MTLKLSLILLQIALCVAFSDSLESVLCPDEQSQCPDGTTCCALRDDQYGCCPIPKAVCCADRLHCCPSETTCDTEHSRCIRGSSHFPIYKKIPALNSQDERSLAHAANPSRHVHHSSQNQFLHATRPTSGKEVKCPDGKSKCPPHTTCCPLNGYSGEETETAYGCCPAEEAVCCEDKLHCCPYNTRCDVEEGRCISENGHSHSWYRKSASTRIVRKQSVKLEPAYITCDNGKSGSFVEDESGEEFVRYVDACESGSKCCIANGTFDKEVAAYCCPFADGVCCSGATHCCPKGFRCTSIDGKCTAETENGALLSLHFIATTDSLQKLSRPRYGKQMETTCPDGKSSCGHMNTCCPVFNAVSQRIDSYECCPLGKGVCCSTSCCPFGYQCVEGDRCEKRAFIDARLN